MNDFRPLEILHCKLIFKITLAGGSRARGGQSLRA
jgi:hypothetical protein